MHMLTLPYIIAHSKRQATKKPHVEVRLTSMQYLQKLWFNFNIYRLY